MQRQLKTLSTKGALLFGLSMTAGLAPSACNTEAVSQQEAQVRIEMERFNVEVTGDDPAMGADNPLVTIVLFSDYQCVPCGRSWGVARALVEHYPDDVRVVYKSFTVPGHSKGDLAAEAAFAAKVQDKFWDMHWKLFANREGFSRPSLRRDAVSAGLDAERFFEDLDTGAGSSLRMRHRRQAKTLGIAALPVGFVNGLFLMGSPLVDEAGMRALVEGEIAMAKSMMRDGTPRAKVYDALMAGAVVKSVRETADAKALREQVAKKTEAAKQIKDAIQTPDPAKRYAVAPSTVAVGPKDAPVVIVEFMDFQCPFCRKAHAEVLPKLREEFKEDLRLEIRHMPLANHPGAPGAARASIAASRQGKFWDFHDKLFEEGRTISQSSFVELARELGLDVDKFKADLADPEVAKMVADDLALSVRLGVSGTPGFFINGKYLNGARSYGTFQGMVQEELARAKTEFPDAPRAELNAKLTAEAVGEAQYPNPAATAVAPPAP